MGLFRKAALTVARGLGLTDQRLTTWFGGEPSHSGESVTVDTALTLDAVWACARLVSQTIATLPLPLYERDDQGRSRVAPQHPLYRVLHDRPNAEMTAVEFWQAMFACKLLWGNGYAEIVRGAGNRVIALLPMRPDRVQVTRETDGSLTYRYTYQGQTQTLSEDQVLHLKGFSLDGQMGMSAVAAGRHSLGTAMGAERVAGRIFKNGMRPSGTFVAPAYLTKEQRQDARTFLEQYRGAQNAGKVPLLEGGWTFVPLSLPPEDAQLLETRGFNIEVICRWFGVLPVMIGHMDKATAWGTGLEQMNLWFLTYTLRSHLKAAEQAIWTKCLTPAEQQRFFAEFNVEGLMRADSKGRAELYSAEVTHGLSTPNEIRARENKPPLPGGDQLFMQGAMLPIDKLGAAPSGSATEVPANGTNRAGGALDGPPFDFDDLFMRLGDFKAFDPSKHPRDHDGRFSGSGGKGRAAKRMARRSLEDRTLMDLLDLGRVPGGRFSQAAGRDVDGWRFGLASEHVRHIAGRHGFGSGDRSPILAADYENLPRLLTRGRVTAGGKTEHQGLATVIVTMSIRGHRYRAVLAVRKRKRSLTVHTFMKR